MQLPAWTFGGVLLVASRCSDCGGPGRHPGRRRASRARSGRRGGLRGVLEPVLDRRASGRARTRWGPSTTYPLLIPLAVFGAAGIGAVIDRSRVARRGHVVLLVVDHRRHGRRGDRSQPEGEARQYGPCSSSSSAPHLGHAVLFMDDRGRSASKCGAVPREHADRSIVRSSTRSTTDPATSRCSTAFPAGPLAHAHRAASRRPAARPDPLRRTTEVSHGRWSRCGSGSSTPWGRRPSRRRCTRVVTRCGRVGPTRGRGSRTPSAGRSSHLRSGRNRSAPRSCPIRGTVEVEAVFSGPGRASDRYQRRYPYAVAGGEARLLTPGWGRYLFRYTRPVWLNQDVDPTIAEVH